MPAPAARRSVSGSILFFSPRPTTIVRWFLSRRRTVLQGAASNSEAGTPAGRGLPLMKKVTRSGEPTVEERTSILREGILDRINKINGIGKGDSCRKKRWVI